MIEKMSSVISLIDVLIILGIISISIGSFLYSPIVGFITMGILLLLFAFSLLVLGGD